MDRGTDLLTGARMDNLIKNVTGDTLEVQENNAMKIQKDVRATFYNTPWGAIMSFMNSCSYYADIDHHTEISTHGGLWSVELGSRVVFRAHPDCDGEVFYQFC